MFSFEASHLLASDLLPPTQSKLEDLHLMLKVPRLEFGSPG